VSVISRQASSPHGLRTVNPTAWPQYPYDSVPATPERSVPSYEIQNDWNLELSMRDGCTILLDVYRPQRPGSRFPALCSFSPYSRQLQRDSAPIGQNEAGITEFWVPHGYAHVIVDVRGTNGSGGDWPMWGPEEQADIVEVIEWVAAQPWCNGRVGMTGCSYFGMVQNLAAGRQAPSLAATFPYDALTDIYRDAFFTGGIPSAWAEFWFTQVQFLNGTSGRNPNMAAIQRQFQAILGLEHPFDGPYHQERSASIRLPDITTPSYFGCDWDFHALHLSGAFDAWSKVASPVKRMLIGPKPTPGRPFAAYHQEALRWYDLHLKDLDTGVLDGAPIRLWIPGLDEWRGEHEWPLARTQWTDFFLGRDGDEGTLSPAAPDETAESVLDYDPAREEWLFGQPELVFRSEPMTGPLEVTGPVQLTLSMASTAPDTDWIVALCDEAPDGSVRELSRGHLRSSHREVDPGQGSRNVPWHPHRRAEPLEPGREVDLEIGIVATSNLFRPGHRIRLQVANCDSTTRPGALANYRKVLRIPARNTVITGPGKSRLSLPVVA
jgi:predicted acyl esterase